jgi:mannose-6-phosphate isomerase-like protein (cupin superfamily)
MPQATLQATTLDDAPAYWFLNTLHILVAKSQSTGGAYSLIHLTATPGFATPYHLHHMEDEAFYVFAGKIRRSWDRGDTSFFRAEYPTGFDAAAKRTLASSYT